MSDLRSKWFLSVSSNYLSFITVQFICDNKTPLPPQSLSFFLDIYLSIWSSTIHCHTMVPSVPVLSWLSTLMVTYPPIVLILAIESSFLSIICPFMSFLDTNKMCLDLSFTVLFSSLQKWPNLPSVSSCSFRYYFISMLKYIKKFRAHKRYLAFCLILFAPGVFHKTSSAIVC